MRAGSSARARRWTIAATTDRKPLTVPTDPTPSAAPERTPASSTATPARPPREAFHDRLLHAQLAALLESHDAELIERLMTQLRWVEVSGGQVLMAQGDAGDSMYLVVSGRLHAYVRAEDGSERLVSEIGRGQIVGEMSLYTGEPRAATVVAIRDSVLVRLDKPAFDALITTNAQVSIALARHIIQRLKGDQTRRAQQNPVAMALVPITAGVDAAAFARELERHLVALGGIRVRSVTQVTHETVVTRLADDSAGQDERARQRRLALLLDEFEADHDIVLLVASPTANEWTQRCCRHADEVLLLADAAQAPAIHETEHRFLAGDGPQGPAQHAAGQVLVLLHPPHGMRAVNTRAWLARRPVADHVHIRQGVGSDMARLARLQSRRGVGLVLAGGGARGFAHLGVLRALAEAGMPIDVVGGTSIGAVMGTYAASLRDEATILANVERAFAVNPTGDVNWVPALSLIKGRRLAQTIERALIDLVGGDAQIEDLWLNFFCVATSFSHAAERVLDQGPLHRALMASIAIPGALPPVLANGELLCDGGTFNNFPVDVMRRRRGIGRVIGVDLSANQPTRIEGDALPDSWALWRDRLRPHASRQWHLPSLTTYLMNVTTLYSASRQRIGHQACDLYFNPPVSHVGMLQWRRLREIVQLGYDHARQTLEETS